MAHPTLFGDDVEVHPSDPARGACEIAGNHVFREADRLEHARAMVALEGADTHFAHDLEQTLARCLDVGFFGLGGVGEPFVAPRFHHLFNGLKRDVRIDRTRSVAC